MPKLIYTQLGSFSFDRPTRHEVGTELQADGPVSPASREGYLYGRTEAWPCIRGARAGIQDRGFEAEVD